MSEKDRRCMDPELEKFLKEHKEMAERLFREEKEMMRRFFKEEKEFFRDAFEEERTKADEFAEKKKKTKETAHGVYNAFTDPEVQKHFMAMGAEFMMAMNALMKAMPFPDGIKDMADKAEKAGKSASDNFCKESQGRKESKPAASEKIEIESAPKKKAAASAKTKTSSAEKATKTSD